MGIKIECECKIRIPSRAPLAERLAELGADDHGEVFERNWTFDRANRELADTARLLRLRTVNDGEKTVITLKRPAQASEFKTREEIEITASSAQGVGALFEGLGYAVEWYYEKRRATWEYKNCEVVLDELPEIGCFIEVEGTDTASIRAVLADLGLDPAAHIEKTYRCLYTDHCSECGEGFRPLKFSQSTDITSYGTEKL